MDESTKTCFLLYKYSLLFWFVGDLTDAKTFDSLGSKQYEDEWKLYKNTLDKCKVSDKTVWLDVRGNHGKFIGLYYWFKLFIVLIER